MVNHLFYLLYKEVAVKQKLFLKICTMLLFRGGYSHLCLHIQATEASPRALPSYQQMPLREFKPLIELSRLSRRLQHWSGSFSRVAV